MASLAVSPLRKCYGEIAIRITVKGENTGGRKEGRKEKVEGGTEGRV